MKANCGEGLYSAQGKFTVFAVVQQIVEYMLLKQNAISSLDDYINLSLSQICRWNNHCEILGLLR